ncbi:MAG TPA: hypothetical protein VHD63_08505 [Ktedonobacteraceae bacterium]|nr:hypothetical protein [Ktedonobacteraceae bacterium]
MAAQRHAIFREKALKHYAEGRKKDVLPHFSSLSAGFFAWLLLAFLIITGLVAWCGQVPIFLQGSGIVLASGSQAGTVPGGANAVAFFAPDQVKRLHVGETTQVQLVAGSSSHITGTMVQVMPETTSVGEALARYGLSLSKTSAPSQHIAVALLKLEPDFPAASYAGSIVVVEASVGTQSLFSALTGLGIS